MRKLMIRRVFEVTAIAAGMVLLSTNAAHASGGLTDIAPVGGVLEAPTQLLGMDSPVKNAPKSDVTKDVPKSDVTKSDVTKDVPASAVTKDVPKSDVTKDVPTSDVPTDRVPEHASVDDKDDAKHSAEALAGTKFDKGECNEVLGLHIFQSERNHCYGGQQNQKNHGKSGLIFAAPLILGNCNDLIDVHLLDLFEEDHCTAKGNGQNQRNTDNSALISAPLVMGNCNDAVDVHVLATRDGETDTCRVRNGDKANSQQQTNSGNSGLITAPLLKGNCKHLIQVHLLSGPETDTCMVDASDKPDKPPFEEPPVDEPPADEPPADEPVDDDPVGSTELPHTGTDSAVLIMLALLSLLTGAGAVRWAAVSARK